MSNADRANPWVDLPLESSGGAYVLPRDTPFLTAERIRTADLRLELLPVPFIGDPARAPVIILQLNPGGSDSNIREELANSDYRRLNRDGVTFKTSPRFWPLASSLKDTPGGRYWQARLKPLINECGIEAVGANLACVEWLPYHSERFKFLGVTLPSQEYGFRVVEDAVQRQALFVLARGGDFWFLSVPGLREADVTNRIVRLRNRRSTYLSAINIQEADGFARICQALSSSRPMPA